MEEFQKAIGSRKKYVICKTKNMKHINNTVGVEHAKLNACGDFGKTAMWCDNNRDR